MADYWTVLLFFVYSFGFGYTILDILKIKEDEHFLTRNIVRIGIGLSIIPILGVFLNILYVPLSWIVFLLLSIAYPVVKLILYFHKHNYNLPMPDSHVNFLKVSKKTLFIIAIILLMLVQFYIMHKGAFGYSWLEDGDPWHHAVTTKYFADDGNMSLSTPNGESRLKQALGIYASSSWLESSSFDTGSASNFYELVWQPLDQPPQTGQNPVRFQLASNNDQQT